VPWPKLIYIRAFEWPENQPGCRPMAPPVTGHLVRFVDIGMPPPRRRVSWCEDWKREEEVHG